MRVVGAGVIGLSAAHRLLERGYRVHIDAREMAAETTSGVAAAIWYPYLALPRDRVLRWGARSFEEFTWLAAERPDAGVRLLPGRELLPRPTPDPWWVDAVPDLRRLGPQHRVGRADGWSFTAPVVDMSRYLPWLLDRVAELGATLTRTTVERLDSPDHELTVDCAGLGAADVAADARVYPVRGQVVVVEQVGLDEWVLDDSDPERPTYVVPRLKTIICGGTAEPGATSLEPDEATAADILARCRALVPVLADAKVLDHRVGLRPARSEVRVERVGEIIHCYGHGGAGVTLSWGCADEVVDLVESAPGGGAHPVLPTMAR